MKFTKEYSSSDKYPVRRLKVDEISYDPVSGINLESLQRAMKKHKIKACIVTPNFHKDIPLMS